MEIKYNYRQRINYVFKNLKSIVYNIKQNNVCKLDHLKRFEKNLNNIIPKTDNEMVLYNK